MRYIRCSILSWYEHMISYVMYIRHRISISDILHCIRYVEVNTYDVVCVTYDVNIRHRTWRTTMSESAVRDCCLRKRMTFERGWHPETEAIVLEHQMALHQLLLRFWVTDHHDRDCHFREESLEKVTVVTSKRRESESRTQ